MAPVCARACLARALVAVLLIVSMPLASTARAQQAAGASAAGAARHGAGFGFGQTFLMGDFSTYFDNSIGFNLNYAYESGPTFGLLVNIHYNNHSSSTSVEDSLSIKGLTPNLKVNVLKFDRLTLSAFAGLGALLVSETRGTVNAGYTLFTLQGGGMANVDIDPHFRFGPSLALMKVSSGTDATAGTTMGGSIWELMFNVMYFF